MRAACRRFLTDSDQFGPFQAHIMPMDLAVALRACFGIDVARISAAYEIDIEIGLARILPEDTELDESLG